MWQEFDQKAKALENRLKGVVCLTDIKTTIWVESLHWFDELMLPQEHDSKTKGLSVAKTMVLGVSA